MSKKVYIVSRFDKGLFTDRDVVDKVFVNKESAVKYVDEMNAISSEIETKFIEHEDKGAAALRQITDLYIEREYPKVWEELIKDGAELDDETVMTLEYAETEFINNPELIYEYANIAELKPDVIDCIKIINEYYDFYNEKDGLIFYRLHQNTVELTED